MPHSTLSDVQRRASALSQSRDHLSGLFATLEAGIAIVKKGSLPEIQKLARVIAKQHTELQQLITANPALFEKPRTIVVDGLKVGMQKKPGKLEWDSDTALVTRIKKAVEANALTIEQQDLLINTTEKPVAKALEKLDGKLLKRLGVTISSDTDEVLIKSVDSDVEKAVNAVIKDATKDANAEVTA
jgi:hypothetical protein